MPVPFDIRHRSGFEISCPSGLNVLKQGNFEVLNVSIAGDAPKQLLRIYEYGSGHKARKQSWPQFIAKGGQKAYPNESITEHFVTRIGQALGIRIADSKLMWVAGQIRFLSRYFLRKNESLVHGAEIFSGYLAQDSSFVREVEEQKYSSQIFTFQVVNAALQKGYPFHYEDIMADLVRLLAFDALVGNNDRHYVNWGVVKAISGRGSIKLAPVYDTARALLWNKTESSLEGWEKNKTIESALDGYIRGSHPKMGWDGATDLNHFDLIQKIANSNEGYKKILRELVPDAFVPKAQQILADEFHRLFSPLRARIVLRCLEKRLSLYLACLEKL